MNANLQFDTQGRLNPAGLSARANPTSRRYFRVNETPPDLGSIYARTCAYLGPCDDLSLTDFKHKVAELQSYLASNQALRPLLQSPMLPFILPQGSIGADAKGALGRYLKGVETSFQDCSPGSQFTDHSIDAWKDQFSTNPQSRAQLLTERSDRASVVGLFMPALSEFSIPAAFEAIDALPSSLTLSGFFEIAAALVGTPRYLINPDAYSPLLWAAANIGSDMPGGFHFAAYGNDMTFNYRAHLGEASEYWWCGLAITSDHIR